ncbi:MAG: metallophosphoesterase family protein [Pseudomonadota bacterium]
MRTLVHLSDLHFGRVDQTLIKPLTAQVRAIVPDVLVVSGDLTQRARSAEFIAARAFLDTLPTPQIVVPGNHDISLYNLYARFMRPLAKYTRYITTDLQPFYLDDEIAVAGVNTARSLTIKDGRINDEQIQQVHARFDQLPDGVVKIVVTHHPFDLPDHYGRHELVDRAPTALETFAACGADLLLAGHLHATHAGTTDANYPIAGYSALAVQAGTATSTRGRGEANSFNVIRIENVQIVIERYSWNENRGAFDCIGDEHFKREGERWLPRETRLIQAVPE